MPKRRFIFARHTATSWNRVKHIQGSVDIELDEGGRNEALELASTLRNLGIIKIVSSDLKRTHETAEIVASVLSIPLVVDPRIRECSYGTLEGMTFEEARKHYYEMKQRDFENFEGNLEDYDFRKFGGEDKKSVLSRHLNFLNDSSVFSEGVVLIVGHGRGLNTLLAFLKHNKKLKHAEFCIVESDKV